MESQQKRRKAISVKMALIEGVGDVLVKHGFHKLGINIVSEEANVSKALIYKYYGSFDDLLRAYIEKQDYWINVLKEHGKNKVENQREFVKELMFRQIDFQLKNKEFSELLIWGLADKEDFASTVTIKRELMSEELLRQYSHLLASHGINFNHFIAVLVSSIYYLIMHKDKTTFCGLDLNKKKDQADFKMFISWLVDLVFDKIEEKEKINQIVRKAQQKGLSVEDIAEITGLSTEEVQKILP